MSKSQNGFIKIYRSILEWEWWDDINVFRLFVTILLTANWKEKKWHGKTIPRGSLWTSVPSLAKKSGLSVQQTKTALTKLKSTGEITDTPTRKGRLITVENYDLYQAVDNLPTDKLTDKPTGNQPAINLQPNRPLTTTKEYIRSKEGKKGSFSPTDFIHELMEGMDDDEEGSRINN